MRNPGSGSPIMRTAPGSSSTSVPGPTRRRLRSTDTSALPPQQ